MKPSEAPFARVLPLRAASVDRGLFDAAATESETLAIAQLFDADRVEGLMVSGLLTVVDDLFRLQGRASAIVTQRCVVTDDPVETVLDVPFDRFIKVGAEPDGAEVDIDPEARDIDYVDEPEVDFGAIAVEELALELPAYPRADEADAALAALDDSSAPESPFAALARRRGAS